MEINKKEIKSVDSQSELLNSRIDSARQAVEEAQRYMDGPLNEDDKKLWEARLQSRKQLLARAEDEFSAYQQDLAA